MKYCKDCYTPNRDHELYCRKCSGKLYRRVRPFDVFEVWPSVYAKRHTSS